MKDIEKLNKLASGFNQAVTDSLGKYGQCEWPDEVLGKPYNSVHDVVVNKSQIAAGVAF